MQHLDQGLSTQTHFKQHIASLSKFMKEMANPFVDDFEDLVTLDSQKCMDKSVIRTLHSLEITGKKQYADFI